MEKISFTHFGMTYGAEKFALHDIDLTINAGDFVVLTGGTGSGKSTLIRQLKREFIAEDYSGSVRVNGIEVKDSTAQDSLDVGYVMQFPREQIVTDKVYHELSFGLENMGISRDEIRLRVSETAHYFGLGKYMDKSTNELSGGEMQVLNLASIMAMRPSILLLDEPTSQLDEVTAEKFIALIYRLNRELGTTIVIAEHRLDMLDHYDSVVIMEEGGIKYVGSDPHGYEELPIYTRVGEILGEDIDNIVECREAISNRLNDNNYIENGETERPLSEKVLRAHDVWYRYARNGADVLKGVDLDVYRGEVLSIVGGNGVGKSTLLKVLSNKDSIYRGKVQDYGNRIVYIAQNIAFLESTLQDEINVSISHYVRTYKDSIKKSVDREERVKDYREKLEKIRDEYLEKFDLKNLLLSAPNQISGGEKAKLAILIGLLSSPDVLLLDEPTKGLDLSGKKIVCDILSSLTRDNKSVILVSHDIELVSKVSERVATLFDGTIVSICMPKKLLRTNYLFTTTSSRICRGICDDITCEEELIALAESIKNNK